MRALRTAASVSKISILGRGMLVCFACGGALLVPGGAARAQIENVVLLKRIDRGESYSGNWGYTSPTGVELAISGTRSGTTFIDATDPVNAQEVEFIPGPTSGWREMATYGEYCYIVTEDAGAALQVVSLADPLNPTLAVTLNPPDVPYTTAHEIKIDQQTGYCYVAGTRNQGNQSGMIILDLTADPLHPTLRGTWTDYYAHDLSLQNGRAYVAAIFDGSVVVLDVTQPGTPPTLGEWTYPGAVTHNTWPSDDGSFLVTTDEVNGGHLKMWDIRNLMLPQQTDEWISPTGAVVHNAYLRGTICYMSHYSDGLRVVDASDPFNLVPVGWYDTGNAWGCYCFAADHAIAYISDIENGTFILRFDPASAGIVEAVPVASAGSNIRLLGGFPNPFNNAASIRFELAGAGPVSLKIYDARGRFVRRLAEGALPSGMHAIAWDGRSELDLPMASGVYSYRLEASGTSESGRLVIAR